MRAFFFVLATLFVLTNGAQAEQVWLTMDQVRPYRLETPAVNIAVGNPSIADVTVQDNQNLLLFGKSPGLTNIYIFDESGKTIKNMVIRVRSPNSDMLTFYRGAERVTYNCTSNCEPTLTVGDAPEAFQSLTTQVQKKFDQAKNAASPSN